VASTHAKYYFSVTRHIIPYFEKTSLRKINQQVINAFISEKAISGKLDGKGGLASKTIHDLIILLNQILEYAKSNDYFTHIDYDFSVPKATAPTLDILSLSEQKQFEQAIIENLKPETLGFLIALFTGVRIGELCALIWSDIHLDEKYIRITKTLQRINNTEPSRTAKTKIVIGQAKSKRSVRNIPIPPFLLEILTTFKAGDDAFVLTGEKDKFFEPRTYQTKYKKFLKENKIRDVNFHILRHTFATRAIEQGFDIKSLSEILGHSSVSFTLEKYVHSSFELKKLHMDKMGLFADRGQNMGQKNERGLDK